LETQTHSQTTLHFVAIDRIWLVLALFGDADTQPDNGTYVAIDRIWLALALFGDADTQPDHATSVALSRI